MGKHNENREHVTGNYCIVEINSNGSRLIGQLNDWWNTCVLENISKLICVLVFIYIVHKILNLYI